MKKVIIFILAIGFFVNIKAQDTLLNEQFNLGFQPENWYNFDSLGRLAIWRFDNPGLRDIPVSPSNSNHTIDNGFAIFDADYYSTTTESGDHYAIMVSDAISTKGYDSTVTLTFNYHFNIIGGTPPTISTEQTGLVSVSVDGGASFNVIQALEAPSSGTSTLTRQSITIPSALNKPIIYIKFTYIGADEQYWVIDDVTIIGRKKVGTPDNFTPIAENDQGEAFQGRSDDYINVLVNDSDPDGSLDQSSVLIIKQGSNGTAIHVGGGFVNYVPDKRFLGIDTFSYIVSDDKGAVSNEAMVIMEVVIDPNNQKPVAVNDFVNTPINTEVLINVLANDYDENAAIDSSSVELVKAPSNGIVLGIDSISGAINYKPNTDFIGTDTLSYKIMDYGGLADTALVIIKVGNTSVFTRPSNAKQILVYPNPSSGAINLFLPVTNTTRDKTAIRVYSITGSLVVDMKMEESGRGFYELNLNGLADGLYHIVLSRGKENFIGKLQIVK